MKAFTVRQIDNHTFERLKNESKKKGMSLNKFIVDCLMALVGTKRKMEYEDLDGFFGSWTDQDVDAVKISVAEQRKIDKDIWS